jgi:amino acid adenylation domain-containing protein
MGADMSHLSKSIRHLPPEQEAIRAKCFHPTGTFEEFRAEEIEHSIPERFEKIAKRYADRIAVKSKYHVLTYRELDRSSSVLARAILEHAGRGHHSIALLLDNDAPMISAILGTLKTGHICVPLDPSFPISRLSSMLKDSEAELIVSDNRHRALVSELAKDGQSFLNVDELAGKETEDTIFLSIEPQRVAYILYTSGSTSEPKGVMQSHRNVLHKAMTQTNTFRISVEDRLTLLYSCSFAASVRCIFCALLNGASLFPYDVKTEGITNLSGWICDEGITVYFSVPAIFRNLIETLEENEILPSVRLLYLGSDIVRKKDIELFRAHFSKESILVNSMAATETGTILQNFIGHETNVSGDIVPVGWADRGRDVFLIDNEARKVGIGAVGEIVVRDQYLSPGYWRRPALTQTKFVSDPDGGGSQIYLTGDLGRMRCDGSFEHLGRKDFLTKIGGLWTDPAAVERSLMALKNVRAASVSTRENCKGVKSLVAYVVPAKDVPVTVEALRRELRASLADYAIPSKFVFLDALPLTPTGKVDPSALPDPGDLRPDLATRFAPSRTAIEADLEKIWTEVLSLDRIGIHDNFFDLGGHSLAATRVVSRVMKKFQLEMPLQSLFQSPTVAQMAAVIAEYQAKKLGDKDLERMLRELESLSDEDARRLLVNQDSVKDGRN